MIRRRRQIIAAFAAAPFAAFAQTPTMPVVGVLALDVEGRVAQVKAGMRELGYEEGRNIRYEARPVGDRYERLASVAQEFVKLKVDVIVTLGNTAAVAASKATKSIPIVMVSGTDPVKEKLAASLSHPGGNVTGLTTIVQDMVPKRLQLAKETIPGLTQLGIMWNPDSRGSSNSYAQTQVAARALQLRLHPVEVRVAADFDKAFATLSASGIRIFVLLASGMFESNRAQLLEAAAKHRLAGLFYTRRWVEEGGLYSYGVKAFEAERRVATYVDRILKGAKPGNLPIEQPATLELIVNRKAGSALGIAVPQAILLRADRVIE